MNRAKINTAEKAMAHRFAQNVRGTIQDNKKDVQLHYYRNTNNNGQQTNLYDQSTYRVLNPDFAPGFGGYEANTMLMMQTDNSIQRVTEQTEGLAGMGKMPDQDDQYFDNVVWYSTVYKNLGGPTDADKHGQDLGKVVLDDRFFKYLERKKEREFARNYEWFKLAMVDLRDEANRAYWQKKFPELVQKKLQFYRNREAIRARWNEICARGPNDRGDLEFMYLYNLGVFNCVDVQDVSDYIANPQDRKIWIAAVNRGVIDWNKVEFNDKLLEPASTPLDGMQAQGGPITLNNVQISDWTKMPKH